MFRFTLFLENLIYSMLGHTCRCAKSLQSCPAVCDPMDCSPPSSSVHGILQARILEWVAMPSSRGSSQPRDQIFVSMCSELAGGFFNTSVTLEAPYSLHSVNYSASSVYVCVCVLGGIFNVYSNPLSRRYFFPCFNDKVTGDKMLTLTEVGINIHCNLHCTTFVDYLSIQTSQVAVFFHSCRKYFIIFFKSNGVKFANVDTN